MLDGDEWVIDGQKIWTSMGLHADWMYVLCRTDPTASAHRGISMLLVPVDQPGVEVRPIRNILGGSDFCEVFFTGARTAADMVVGEVDGGWKVAMGALGTERGTTLLSEHLRFQTEVDAMIADGARSGERRSAVMRADLVRAWSRRAGGQVERLPADDRAEEGRRQRLCAGLDQQGLRQRRTSTDGRDRDARQGTRSELVGPDYGLDRLQQVMLSSRAESIYGGTTQIQLNVLAERTLGLAA